MKSYRMYSQYVAFLLNIILLDSPIALNTDTMCSFPQLYDISILSLSYLLVPNANFFFFQNEGMNVLSQQQYGKASPLQCGPWIAFANEMN